LESKLKLGRVFESIKARAPPSGEICEYDKEGGCIMRGIIAVLHCEGLGKRALNKFALLLDVDCSRSLPAYWASESTLIYD
jgi:hypothetical protein